MKRLTLALATAAAFMAATPALAHTAVRETNIAENATLAINWGPFLQWLGFEAGDFVFIPTGYKAAAAFVLLILALLVRPQGLLGGKR